MSELAKKKCLPCEEKTGKLEPVDAAQLAEELDKWKIVDDQYIEKTLQFLDFKSAVAFLNRVSEIAEQENHHPDMEIFSWNKLKLRLSTHSVKGLTENDFILAAKIDELAR